MITLRAPPSRWRPAFSREVKIPVDSTTTSTPRSPQGRSAGLRSERTRISTPSTTIPCSVATTSESKRPWTESLARRNAIVSIEPRSFTATNSRSAPCDLAARKKLRPIRPKPFTPIRTVILLDPPAACQSPVPWNPPVLSDTSGQTAVLSRQSGSPIEISVDDRRIQSPGPEALG